MVSQWVRKSCLQSRYSWMLLRWTWRGFYVFCENRRPPNIYICDNLSAYDKRDTYRDYIIVLQISNIARRATPKVFSQENSFTGRCQYPPLSIRDHSIFFQILSRYYPDTIYVTPYYSDISTIVLLNSFFLKVTWLRVNKKLLVIIFAIRIVNYHRKTKIPYVCDSTIRLS